MTVVHVHGDAASLEYHLDVAGPAFRKLADLITLSSIRVYGEPSKRALMQLHDKARLLGRDDVAVHVWRPDSVASASTGSERPPVRG
jgi:hypothetical protein